MKCYKVILHLVFILFIYLSLKSQSIDFKVAFSQNDFNIKAGESSILPCKSYFLVLPHGAEVKSVQGLINDAEFLMDGDSSTYPKTRSLSEDDSLIHKQILYNPGLENLLKDNSKDNDIVTVKQPEILAGYSVVEILISPFFYNSENNLYLAKNLELKIDYVVIKDKIFDYDTTEKNIEISRESIRQFILNSEDLEYLLPLNEKIDYSKIKKFNELEIQDSIMDDMRSQEMKEQDKLYYIKRIK